MLQNSIVSGVVTRNYIYKTLSILLLFATTYLFESVFCSTSFERHRNSLNPSNDCAWVSLNLCQVMSGSCQRSSNENVSRLVSRMQYVRTLKSTTEYCLLHCQDVYRLLVVFLQMEQRQNRTALWFLCFFETRGANDTHYFYEWNASFKIGREPGPDLQWS